MRRAETIIRWSYPDHFPAPAYGAKPVLWWINDTLQQVGWLMPSADFTCSDGKVEKSYSDAYDEARREYFRALQAIRKLNR